MSDCYDVAILLLCAENLTFTNASATALHRPSVATTQMVCEGDGGALMFRASISGCLFVLCNVRGRHQEGNCVFVDGWFT